ncbi:MAG: TonB C-terminal domain-containing protein [Polyangiaceae bacterium]|nr:TonB C-terminal domain-containing protein [Polyangiaceae bacterium]
MPAARRRSSLDLVTAGSLSLAAHVCGALVLVGFVHLARITFSQKPRELGALPTQTPRAEIQLPEIEIDSPLLADKRQAEEAPIPPVGGADVARPDLGRGGRGGDETSRDLAINFANQDDGVTLDTSVLSNLTKSQLPRIDSGKLRFSWEDMRASREPMELTFVAMGTDGIAEERRREALQDPARGLATTANRSDLGSFLGAGLPGDTDSATRPGSNVFGGPLRTTGLGFAAGANRGLESAALRNAHARPLVDKNDPMVDANNEGKPSDTVDSEQAVSKRMAELLSASTAGGAAGSGKGGTGGGGTPASGGTSGAGSKAAPLGAGGQGPGDVERMGYLRAVQGKVHPLWANAMPRWAILEGRQASATVTFVIEADGSVSSARVTKSSGIPEFDENVRKAILKGANYGPLPAALRPRLVWAFPFHMSNPAVRPKNPKDGPI